MAARRAKKFAFAVCNAGGKGKALRKQKFGLGKRSNAGKIRVKTKRARKSRIEGPVAVNLFRLVVNAMVLITLSTIGFGEVHPLTESGKWLTTCIIISGVMQLKLQVH